MKQSEIFSLIVRTVGLLTCLFAVYHMSIAIVALFSPAIGTGFLMFIAYVPVMLLGLWLLRGAKKLMSFAYPEEDPDKI